MIPRPEFRVQPDSPAAPCDVCSNTASALSLKTFIQETQVETICADCVIAISKAFIATPAMHELLDLDDRAHLAQALKASHTQTLVKRSENTTAKRLLS
jgi:hypothetical protein